MAARGFQEVSPPQETADVVGHPSRENTIAAQALTLILKGLSQKALIAISSLFTSAALFSAWWLWMTILPDPSNRQLIGVGMYAVFILAVEVVRRR